MEFGASIEKGRTNNQKLFYKVNGTPKKYDKILGKNGKIKKHDLQEIKVGKVTINRQREYFEELLT